MTAVLKWNFREASTKPRPKASGVVTDSSEFRRIFGLPRRALDLRQVQDVTPLFRRPGGTMSFWPIQSAALIEAAHANGLFAPIGVGRGKSLICLALPEALDSKRAVLLVPAALRRQVVIEARSIYNRHFVLPMERITIVSYEELSTANNADVLERLQPDLIVCDEVHALKSFSAARTKRFLRYMKEHPECRFAALSGTITAKSIVDYGHILELALRKNSPLPRAYPELMDWSGALDARPMRPVNPGVLLRFCEGTEEVREGYRRRLTETQGVVASDEGKLDLPLTIRRLRLVVPPAVTECLVGVRKTWKIGEDEFDSILTLQGALRQVACGFFYRWQWPNGEPTDAEVVWLEARSAWHKEVRDKLKSPRPLMDSPWFLAAAAERHRKWALDPSQPKPELPLWDSETWAAWRPLRDIDPPPTVPVWIDDFLVDAAIAWAKAPGRRGAIIWYWWNAVGERIAQKGRFPIYGAGADATTATAPVIVCSMQSQGTGKNLQHRYHQNLMTTLPGAALFEQVIGRTHRNGQTQKQVSVEYFGHTPEIEDAMDTVVSDSEYVQQTTGQLRKILYANVQR